MDSLNQFIESKKHEIDKKEIARRLKMSENGLHKAIKQESLKLKTFQQFCEVVQVNPCYFFSDHYGFNPPDSQKPETISSIISGEIVPKQFHEEMMRQKDSEIAYLKQLISSLMESKK